MFSCVIDDGGQINFLQDRSQFSLLGQYGKTGNLWRVRLVMNFTREGREGSGSKNN